MASETSENSETAEDEKPKTKVERKLKYVRFRGWLKLPVKTLEAVYEFCEAYRSFLASAKTEREVCTRVAEHARANNFIDIAALEDYRPGAQVIMTNRGKCVALAVLGSRPLEEGANLLATHTDSPRLDLKPHPLLEDETTNLALFDTHYYGGLRNYQWVNRPLALHGYVVRNDGTPIEIVIGEKEAEPAFLVPDLLIHLSKEQNTRLLPEGIKGEELDVLVGSRPYISVEEQTKSKTKTKLWILDYLHREYGMVEEDFISAEFELVPATPPRDIGFDRSMIGAYGHDNRVSVYPALRAVTELEIPSRTAVAIFFDKEEIGSEGATGAKSRFIEEFYAELLERASPHHPKQALNRALSSTKALCCDVKAGINPIFKGVQQETNAAKLGYGITITKYTGARGKVGASDASAEYVGAIRRLFKSQKIRWQPSTTGRVDEGGGGTVAKFLAQRNMDVVDIGIPVLSMHSPFEIVSKFDVYSAWKAYKLFLTKAG